MARRITLGSTSHQIRLAAAETEAGSVAAGTRPRLKAGTFTLLTVAP